MRKVCIASGGGAGPCEGNRWSKPFFLDVLESCRRSYGLEQCLDVTCNDGKETCTADLAPFPEKLADVCVANGGGEEVCRKVTRWDKGFYKGLLEQCVSVHGWSQCITASSHLKKNGPNALIPRWLPEWNNHVWEAIEAPRNRKLLENSFAPKGDLVQGEQMCPGYYRATDAEKKAFWTAVMATIARWESNFDPTVFNPTDPGGGSNGLMQLSYPDGQNPNFSPCAIKKSANNILDPKVNIQCGVSILRAQIEKRGKIFHSRKERFYWRVLEIYGQGAILPYVRDSYARLKYQLPFCSL